MSYLVQTAVALASEAHGGQFDKGGKPYIHHPLRVMDTVDLNGLNAEDAEVAMCVAVLHDVVEDCKPPQKWAQRIHAQLGDRISVLVEIMTRPPGLTYRAYIHQVGKNEITRRVKIADLTHNMDLTRLVGTKLTPKQFERLQDYLWALDELTRDR